MAWYITDGVLQKADKAPAANSILTNITGSGNIVIPEGVTSIGDYAFFGCESLTSITIPNSITSIGNWAFHCCTNLSSITIPEGVTSIGDLVFHWCKNLTSITIPNSVTSLGTEAFSKCYHLSSISIPFSITSIGDRVFYECYELMSISIPAVYFAKLDKDMFKRLQTISCPISLKDAPANVRLKLCIGFALHQDNYSDDLRTEYLAHIKKNAAKLVGAAFDYPELLYLMCREKLISAKAIDAFTEEAIKRENVELTALILDYQSNSISAKDITKARERKEKVREQQEQKGGGFGHHRHHGG